ncbi:MAG: hypothetical protein H7145_19245 [Akkermansiaceae bacterium]|nr:hypothetical protein [Armatimonadota bacterium]
MRTSPRYTALVGGSFATLGGLTTLVAITPSAASAQGLATIRLTAAPYTIKADGRSTTVITAEVRDDAGRVVPDGTQVRFAVTAGRLDNTLATTQNGVARVILTSGDLPAASLITANLDSGGRATPAQITVIFSNEADAAEIGPQWVRINGSQYTGYAADKGVIQANGKDGGAKVSFRNIELSADALQYEVRTGNVVAAGNVKLTVGDDEKQYTNLNFNMLSGQGIAERIDAEGRSTGLWVDAIPVITEKPPGDGSRKVIGYEAFALADISDSSVAVTARGINIQPGRVIQFRGATFYLDGVKTASLPFHVMPLNQRELFAEQVVGVNSQGVTVDFPLYLNVQPSGINTLHIRRGSRVGSSAYSNKAGWSFDLEQNYNGKRSEGTAQVTGLTRSDWGAFLRHAERLPGKIDGNLYMDTPNHSDLFGTMNLSRRFGSVTLNANGSGSYAPSRNDINGNRTRAGGDVRTQLYGATDPRPLLGVQKLNYSLNLGTARQMFYGVNAEGRGYVDTHYTTLRLTTPQLPLTRSVSVSQSFSLGQTWVAPQRDGQTGLGSSGATVLGTTAFGYRFGRVNFANMTYDYTQTPLTNGFTSDSIGRHRVGFSLYAEPFRAASLSIGASRGLDVPSDNVTAELNVALGGPWRTRTRYFTAQYAGAFSSRFNELEYGVFYRLGGRDLAVYYSTTSRRLQFDIVGARF